MEKLSMNELKNQLISELKQLSKKSILKWIAFIAFVYAVYDMVYLNADSRRLMLDLKDVPNGLLSKLILHIDVPLVVGIVLLCLVFAKHNVISAFALRTKMQVLWMFVGIAFFVVVVYLQMPSTMIDAYRIIHALVVTALVEELVFRGVLFNWMLQAQLRISSYLISGLAWGALLGIRPMVVNDASAIGAILPMALMGVVVGSVYALLYKKTDSLWLVVYLHAALSLL